MGARNFIEQLYPSDEEVIWAQLSQFVEKRCLFILSSELKMDDVIELIANNQAKKVEEMIERGKIKRPCANKVHLWEQAPYQLFKYLMIDPYIIIQEFSPEKH